MTVFWGNVMLPIPVSYIKSFAAVAKEGSMPPVQLEPVDLRYGNPILSRIIPDDNCAVLPSSKMLPASNLSGSSSL
ncbi:hypothetical protein V9T40_013677 [Parthenolecanium corni]|uniref:Uncharacterized protein n=1 Tax=Parthenolecanium corni TaxID=536013 RepID=A0AAN9TFA4_9HEMI